MHSIPRLTRRDATRLSIVDKADELFHRFGFYKTTVADIARELKMSPANVYKFFSSKNALVQAVAERSLSLIKAGVTESVKNQKSPSDKIKALVLFIYRFHKSKLRHEQEIYRLVLAAHDEQWPCVLQFKEFLHEVLGEILRNGVNANEFAPMEISITAEVLLDSLTWIINPLLMFTLKDAQVIKKIDNQTRFIERALARNASRQQRL
jgi:TetR/AcrR family transcriptional repressor of the ameABC operon